MRPGFGMLGTQVRIGSGPQFRECEILTARSHPLKTSGLWRSTFFPSVRVPKVPALLPVTHTQGHLPNIRRIQRLKRIQVGVKLDNLRRRPRSQESCSWEPRISGQVLELQEECSILAGNSSIGTWQITTRRRCATAMI